MELFLVSQQRCDEPNPSVLYYLAFSREQPVVEASEAAADSIVGPERDATIEYVNQLLASSERDTLVSHLNGMGYTQIHAEPVEVPLSEPRVPLCTAAADGSGDVCFGLADDCQPLAGIRLGMCWHSTGANTAAEIVDRRQSQQRWHELLMHNSQALLEAVQSLLSNPDDDGEGDED